MAFNPNVVAEQNDRIDELAHSRAFLVVAAACPGLAAATTLHAGVVMGCVLLVSAVCAWAFARLVPRFAGRLAEVPVALMLNACVIVLVGFAVRVADPVVYEDLGMYLPLAGMGGAASLFIAQGGVVSHVGGRAYSLLDAISAGALALSSLTVIGFLTEVLGTGTVFGTAIPGLAGSPIAIFGKPAGSLLLLALVAVVLQAGDNVAKKGGER